MNNSQRTRAFMTTITLAAAVSLLPRATRAHCDSLDGPVVIDARKALSTADVTPALKWVATEDQETIRGAFRKTMGVRKVSAEARELADMYFFETLVRVLFSEMS